MRRMTWTAAIILCFSLVLSACGTKDAESVVKELDKVINSMESYQGSGTMTLHTGQQPQEYQVEVSYQKPSYYRIKLTNEEKDITQIVLRNDDGVFVLTPKLNKVFRFQSDWPQNQGQVYLYQTLIQSIMVDGSRQFAVDEQSYVFDVMANYNNGSLARQKIWLDKDDLSPVQVEVSDTNATVMVDVKFDDFRFGTKFEKAVFETEANMKASSSSDAQEDDKETTATPEQSESTPEDSAFEGEETGEEENVGEGSDPDSGAATSGEGEAAEDFAVMGPTYYPIGVSMKDSADIVFGGNPGQITRYDGTYSYSLIQTQQKDLSASLVPGLLYDLGFTMGEMTSGDGLLTLHWTYHGSQFRLTTSNLPESEMIKVAQSVQAELGK